MPHRNWSFKKKVRIINPVKSASLIKYTPFKVLVKCLDRVYSVYIRLLYLTPQGFIRCYTCGGFMTFRKAQNGHYISREEMGTRFYRPNCKPQCYDCNINHEGRKYIYAKKLLQEYGPDILDTLQSVANAHKQFIGFDLEELIKYYRVQVKILKQEKQGLF